MSDKFWQTLRKLRKVGKLPYKIDVPEFSVDSGRRTCLLVNGTQPNMYVDNVDLDNQFTAMFWIKLIGAQDVTSPPNLVVLINADDISLTDTYRITVLEDNTIRFAFITSDDYNYASTGALQPDVWTHVAVVYYDNSVKFYFNGQLDSDSGALGGTGVLQNTGNGFYIGYLPQAYPADTGYYISGVQWWNIVLTIEQINNYMFTLPGQLDNGLLVLAPLNDSADINVMPKNLVDGQSFTSTEDVAPYYEDYPHCHVYNGSFVVGEFILDTPSEVPFSLKYPVRKPNDCTNWFPCISWVEDNCNCPYPTVKRYQLWHVCAEECVAVGTVGCGEDAGVFNIPDYNGETIPSGAKLEIWSIDGEVLAELEDILTLLTSVLQVATDPNNTANTALLTLVNPDTELFATFPWTFPVAFNEPLTF